MESGQSSSSDEGRAWKGDGKSNWTFWSWAWSEEEQASEWSWYTTEYPTTVASTRSITENLSIPKAANEGVVGSASVAEEAQVDEKPRWEQLLETDSRNAHCRAAEAFPQLRRRV